MNITFWTQLEGLDPTEIKTHFDERLQVRLRPLEHVSHLIAAYQRMSGSSIANTEIGLVSVYSYDGAELKVDTKLSSLETGKTAQTPLVLKVTHPVSAIELVQDADAIARFGIMCHHDLDERERFALRYYFPTVIEKIKTVSIDPVEAMHWLGRVKTRPCYDTIIHVSQKHAYCFGDSIRPGLLKVFNVETGQFFIGHVYMNDTSNESLAAAHEMSMSKMVCHPNIVLVQEKIEFAHQDGSQEALVALLMPMVSMSLDELCKMMKGHFPFHIFVGLVLGLLRAASRFVEKGLSHGNINPENVMIHEFVPVLIDFGSVVPLGHAVKNYSLSASLDADQETVSPEFDLLCIVSTLVSCILPDFKKHVKTRSDMVDYLEANPKETMISHVKLCLEMLNHASSMIALAALESRFSDVYTDHASFQ